MLGRLALSGPPVHNLSGSIARGNVLKLRSRVRSLPTLNNCPNLIAIAKSRSYSHVICTVIVPIIPQRKEGFC